MIRITTCALVAALLAGCGHSSAEVRKAQTSAYDADFAVVYSETLVAVQKLYPHVNENPSAGVIRTAWHQVQVDSTNETTPSTAAQVNDPTGAQGTGSFGQDGQQIRRMYFVRFRVYVLGGRPWRVRIEGEDSEIEPGMKPSPLKGAQTPAWLKGRVHGLQVAIYRRLKKHAVKYDRKKRYARSDDGKKPKKPEVRSFGDLPAAATAAIGKVRAAVLSGNLDKVRPLMVDDFVWSFGSGGNADIAIVQWKADETYASKLVQVLDAGCATEGETTVVCPADATAADYIGRRASFILVGDTWMMSSFVEGD